MNQPTSKSGLWGDDMIQMIEMIRQKSTKNANWVNIEDTDFSDPRWQYDAPPPDPIMVTMRFGDVYEIYFFEAAGDKHANQMIVYMTGAFQHRKATFGKIVGEPWSDSRHGRHSLKGFTE